MTADSQPTGDPAAHSGPPGTKTPRRFRPRLRYELLGCALHGHELLGTDAENIREQDGIFVRESETLRWHRCMRCDSWLPLPRPVNPVRPFPPERDEVVLPLRGKPLRDRFVLRVIAVNRALHVVLFGIFAVLIFFFADHREAFQRTFVKVLAAFQENPAPGASGNAPPTGILRWLQHLLAIKRARVLETGAVVAFYAVLEAVEMVGLWMQKRWAEYLTFLAVTLLLPLEIYEISHRVTVLRVLTLVVNLGIAGYLLTAKKLFGVRGGGKAEHAERARDIGWPAIERATPGTEVAPSHTWLHRHHEPGDPGDP